MATIGTPTYSNFIGSPVIVPVTARNYANATFHRLRLTVTVNSATSYEFSAPVSPDELTVQFDISSALRAFAENHEYSATALNQYPNLSASCVACSDYMLNGEIHENVDPSAPTAISGLYAGKLTDLERITGTRPARYSRKPTNRPEVVFLGGTYLYPGPAIDGITPSAPHVDVFPIDEQTVSQQNIYAIKQPKDGYEIRFINSLGALKNEKEGEKNFYANILHKSKYSIINEVNNIPGNLALDNKEEIIILFFSLLCNSLHLCFIKFTIWLFLFCKDKIYNIS